jgi:hypothetical protein
VLVLHVLVLDLALRTVREQRFELLGKAAQRGDGAAGGRTDLETSELFGTDNQIPGSWMSASWAQPQYKQPKRARKAPASPQDASHRLSSSSSSTSTYDSDEAFFRFLE